MLDLPALFTRILTSGGMAQFPFESSQTPEQAYAEFLDSLKTSAASTLVCEVTSAAELRRRSAVGLMLSDTVVVTGFDTEEQKVTIRTPDARSAPMVSAPGLGVVRADFATYGFTPEVVDAWAEDARELIVRGRLLYVPVPVALWGTTDASESRPILNIAPVDLDARDQAWRVRGTTEALDGDVLRIAAASKPALGQEVVEAAAFTLPTLGDLALRRLAEVILDEEDAYLRFRAELRKGLREYLSRLPAERTGDDVRSAGLRYRVEVIDPEVAVLRQRLRRVVRSRSLRAAGAVLTNLPIAITAAHAVQWDGLTKILAAFLTSAAVKAVGEHYVGYREDVASLHDCPWSFALRLQRTSARHRRAPDLSRAG